MLVRAGILVFFATVRVVLADAMPCRSASALASRRQRAIERGFLVATSSSWGSMVAVPPPLASRVRVITKSLTLQAKHNELAGACEPFARSSTRAARKFIQQKEYTRAMVTHDRANMAKHVWGGGGRGAWADAWSDDEDAGSSCRSHPPSGDPRVNFPSAESGATAPPPPPSGAPLNPLAPEFGMPALELPPLSGDELMTVPFWWPSCGSHYAHLEALVQAQNDSIALLVRHIETIVLHSGSSRAASDGKLVDAALWQRIDTLEAQSKATAHALSDVVQQLNDIACRDGGFGAIPVNLGGEERDDEQLEVPPSLSDAAAETANAAPSGAACSASGGEEVLGKPASWSLELIPNLAKPLFILMDGPAGPRKATVAPCSYVHHGCWHGSECRFSHLQEISASTIGDEFERLRGPLSLPSAAFPADLAQRDACEKGMPAAEIISGRKAPSEVDERDGFAPTRATSICRSSPRQPKPTRRFAHQPRRTTTSTSVLRSSPLSSAEIAAGGRA